MKPNWLYLVKNLLLDDAEFIANLTFKDLQNEYQVKKKEIYGSVEERYEKNKQDRISKKLEGIEQDKYHRMVLNACIFPFTQEGPLAKHDYYFVRASPFSELRTSNMDFLLLHPEFPPSAIFGEVKGSVNDPERIVDETKKRMKMVYDNEAYVQHNYFNDLKSDLEFVMGVWTSYGNEVVKSVVRKGGQIKVWSTGYQIDSTRDSLKSEHYLVRPLSEINPNVKTMFHKDTSLNQKLSSHIQTSFEYKNVFPDSHKFTKSSLLSLIEENDDGEFTFNDLFGIVKEELDYLEEDRIKRETEDILMIGEEIKFIEKVD